MCVCERMYACVVVLVFHRLFCYYMPSWCVVIKKEKENKHIGKKKKSQTLTCQCPEKSSRKVWLFWDGPVACGFCILYRHVWSGQNKWAWKTWETERGKKKVGNILVVVLFLLFSPVLVELVNLHSSISLLKQVKCLHTTT